VRNLPNQRAKDRRLSLRFASPSFEAVLRKSASDGSTKTTSWMRDSGNLLLTAGKQRAEVVGTQKSVAMNLFEDFLVAFS
jgi:hypothetical protein